MELSKNQIIGKLNTDANFLIRFIIDNNENAVVQNMKADGVPLPANYSKVDVLDAVYNSLSAGKTKSVIGWLDVPYDASSPTPYTLGLGDYFTKEWKPLTGAPEGDMLKTQEEGSTTPTASQGASFGTLLLGTIGQVAGALGNIFGQQQPPPPQQQRKSTTWVWVLVGIVAIVVLFFVFRGKGKGKILG